MAQLIDDGAMDTQTCAARLLEGLCQEEQVCLDLLRDARHLQVHPNDTCSFTHESLQYFKILWSAYEPVNVFVRRIDPGLEDLSAWELYDFLIESGWCRSRQTRQVRDDSNKICGGHLEVDLAEDPGSHHELDAAMWVALADAAWSLPDAVP